MRLMFIVLKQFEMNSRTFWSKSVGRQTNPRLLALPLIGPSRVQRARVGSKWESSEYKNDGLSPAHQSLRRQIGISLGRLPRRSRDRPSGRPGSNCLDQIRRWPRLIYREVSSVVVIPRWRDGPRSPRYNDFDNWRRISGCSACNSNGPSWWDAPRRTSFSGFNAFL